MIDEKYWDKEIETLPRKSLEKLQLKRLNESLRSAKRSNFYCNRIPEKINSLDELKDIPFTTKNDLRNSFPCGMVSVNKDEIIRLHSSSGTTGRATVIYHYGLYWKRATRKGVWASIDKWACNCYNTVFCTWPC